MKKVLIIDDDSNMSILKEALIGKGFEATQYFDLNEAKKGIRNIQNIGCIILDLYIPIDGEIALSDKSQAVAFITALRQKKYMNPILVYSAIQEGHIIEAISSMVNVSFLSKWETPSLKNLVERIGSLMGKKAEPEKINIFIVHGHDVTEKLSLKNYLQNTLHLAEPIILHEQPNHGMTIMEKLENYSMNIDLVFILLTPDDIASTLSETNDKKRRARQNVIFEMGYFLGMLGRKSGKVILLHKGPIDIPSDISGIIYIDITNGIDSAGELIRREVLNG